MEKEKVDYSNLNSIRKYITKVVTDALETTVNDPKVYTLKHMCGVTVILFNERKTVAEEFALIAIKAPHVTVANRIRYRILKNFTRNTRMRYVYMDNFSGMKEQSLLDLPCKSEYIKVVLDKPLRLYSPARSLYSYTSPHTGRIVLEYQIPDLSWIIPNCIRHMVLPEVKRRFQSSDQTILDINMSFSNISKELYDDPNRYARDWDAFTRIYMKLYNKAPGAMKTSTLILDRTIEVKRKTERS